MDDIKERSQSEESVKERKRGGIFSRISEGLDSAKEARAGNRHALMIDLLLFGAAFIFARRQIAFGAYPLAIAFISALPFGVWQAALGALIGAFSLGQSGIIYAVTVGIVTFLRVIISGGKGSEDTALFSEGLLLRMSSAVIGGFVAAVYRVLLYGLFESILFSASMILMPPLLTFALSGIFDSGITLSDLIYSNRRLFSLAGKEDSERANLLFFQCSAAALLFFVSLSLSEFELFGISASHIFISFTVLMVSRRLGALRALGAGFISSLGISSALAVSAALAGLSAGLLFPFGIGYAIVGGGAALGAWGAYSGGITGLLTSLPEYAIAATVAFPFLKNLPAEASDGKVALDERSAQDMVGTMALAYRASHNPMLDALEASLGAMAGVLTTECDTEILKPEEYEEIVCECADEECRTCDSLALCNDEKICPAKKNAERIAHKLSRGEEIGVDDVNTPTEFCARAKGLSESIAARAARAERRAHRAKGQNAAALEYELIGRLINEARLNDAREREVNPALSDRLSESFAKQGFPNGVIRAFGERKKHFIMAGEDESGEKITSPELKEWIESTAGIKLGTPEYFRHGKMVLMECSARRAFSAECATAYLSADATGVSGDSIIAFESLSDCFYCLLSDGMGKGRLAKETSDFVTKYLRSALDFGASRETLLHLLNAALRRRSEESSATVDLFELDLLNGEACFLKSGAAPSYIKRDSSVFRIKSQTAPIGLLSTIDTEKIRASVLPGDYVILLSDGVSQSTEDSAWLLDLLAKAPPKSLSAYADSIIKAARRSCDCTDDMSVSVIRISEV